MATCGVTELVIRPGLPGLGDGGGSVFPTTVHECVEIFRGLGAEAVVESPDAELVELRGDLWLPILVFGSQVAAGALGELVATAIESLVRRRSRTPSVVRVRVERSGPLRSVLIDAEGSADDVVRALRELR